MKGGGGGAKRRESGEQRREMRWRGWGERERETCNTTSPIAHIHRTNKTISVSLTNANSKRDSLVFLSLISFHLYNSNTRAKFNLIEEKRTILYMRKPN